MTIADISKVMVASGAALGVVYLLAHVWAERARRGRLRGRPAEFAESAMVSVAGGESTAMNVVITALAGALGVPPEKIRLTDRFDGEYRLPCASMLLDEWDEQFVAGLNEELGRRGLPPFGGSFANVRTVHDLVRRVHEHVEAFEPRRA